VSVDVSVGSEVPERGEQDEDVHHGSGHGQGGVLARDFAKKLEDVEFKMCRLKWRYGFGSIGICKK